MANPSVSRSVIKTLKLLDYFTADHWEWGLSDIARAVGEPKTTVARCLESLQAAGFLSKDEKTRNYRLGYKLMELGSLVRDKLEIRRIALPFMKSLSSRSSETVRLTALDGNEGIYLETIECKLPVRLWTPPNSRGPLHAGASRKILLAYLPEEEIDAILGQGLTGYTKATITDPDELKRHLAQIRKQGWAYSEGEWYEDSACIAAPIRDRTGRVVAGLSIVGPSGRMAAPRTNELISMVLRTAGDISLALGYEGYGGESAPGNRSTTGER